MFYMSEASCDIFPGYTTYTIMLNIAATFCKRLNVKDLVTNVPVYSSFSGKDGSSRTSWCLSCYFDCVFDDYNVC